MSTSEVFTLCALIVNEEKEALSGFNCVTSFGLLGHRKMRRTPSKMKCLCKCLQLVREIPPWFPMVSLRVFIIL